MEPQPGPALPPGGLFEIIFSFDTTGSMSSVLDEVRGRLQDMIQRLQADIPGIRIGAIAHGDYCDKDVFYLEKHVDLTTDVKELCDFVREVDGTGGGDPEECYELILKMAYEDFTWTPGSQRALVVIGDSSPHEPDYELNVDNIDWRVEAGRLGGIGVKVYGVQAFDNEDGTKFFQELTELTAGHHLKLGQFSNICDFIMAICYRERGEDFLEGYEAEVRARDARKGLHKDLEGLFGTLKKGDSSLSNVSGSPVVSKRPSLVSSLSSASSRSRSPVAVVKPVARVTAVKPAVVKRTTPKKLRLNKPKKDDKPDLKYREKLLDKDFILKQNNLASRWSPWKLAITCSDPHSDRVWKQRSKGRCGWQRRQLFQSERNDKRVLYEIAVQTRQRGRKYVIFNKWSRTGANAFNWEKRLFGQRHLADQVEQVLSQNCNIYVRRFVVSKLGRNQQTTLRNYRNMYDYAWSFHSDDRHRQLLKNKVVISDSKFIRT